VQWHTTRGEGLRAYTGAEGSAGPGICWVCASTAHGIRACPYRKTRHQVLTCTACEKKGHVERVCWQAHPEMRPTPEQFERATRGNSTGYRPGGAGRGRNQNARHDVGAWRSSDEGAHAAWDDPDEFLDLWDMLWEAEARAAEEVLDADLAAPDPPIEGYAGVEVAGAVTRVRRRRNPRNPTLRPTHPLPRGPGDPSGRGRVDGCPSAMTSLLLQSRFELGKLQHSTSSWAHLAAEFLRGKRAAFPKNTLEDARKRTAIDIAVDALGTAPEACPTVVARAALGHGARRPRPAPGPHTAPHAGYVAPRPTRPSWLGPWSPLHFSAPCRVPGAGGRECSPLQGSQLARSSSTRERSR